MARDVKHGNQEPRIRYEQEYAYSDGAVASKLATQFGLTPDPWQKTVLEAWLARNEDDSFRHLSCGLSVPRQNGKNALIEMRELCGLVACDEIILHTSHRVDTNKKAFLRLCEFFNPQKYPDMAERVKKISRTNGMESIELKTGGMIEFSARTRSGARGASYGLVIFDEAQELTAEQSEAIMFTLSASKRERQMVYTGTPPGLNAPGDIFAQRRLSALNKANDKMCWHEWSVEELGDVSDRKRWYATNPAMGYRFDYLCRRTMNETVLEGVKTSGRRMFARVPNGFHTCAFCFMLASRGFVYWSRASAGEFNHYHSNCRCTIVPGDPEADHDTQVEGYQPSRYYKQYEDCLNAVKTPNRSYDYEFFKKDVAKGKYENTSDDWTRWKDNRLKNEIRSRDVNWRWTGKPVKYEIMEGAKPNEREKGTAITLGNKGRKVIFKPTKDEEEEKSCDVFDITNGKKKPIEFKCPIGGGEQTIYHQFEDGAGQSEILLIDISNSSLDVDDSYNNCKRFINWKFKIKTGKDKGRQWTYKEVRLISGNDLYAKIER